MEKITIFTTMPSGPYDQLRDGFGQVVVKPAGVIVNVEAVTRSTRARLPAYLKTTFDEVHGRGLDAQLVTCRKIGIPERADGHHMHMYLVPHGQNLRATCMTI